MRRGWGRTALRVLTFVVAFAALVAFSVVLAELTLTPSPASRGIAGSNLQPGHSLRQYLDDYTFLGACKQVGGNLLIGAPFGVLLPVLVPRRLRMLRVVVLTALVMVLVELAQGALVEGRAFDVDDVILNTSGAIIAYALIGRIIGHKYHALADPRPVPARRGWFGSGGRFGGPGADPLDGKPAPRTPETYRTLKKAKQPKESRAWRMLRNLKRVKESEGLEQPKGRPTSSKTSKASKTSSAAKGSKASQASSGSGASRPAQASKTAKTAKTATKGKPAAKGNAAAKAPEAVKGAVRKAVKGTGDAGAKRGTIRPKPGK